MKTQTIKIDSKTEHLITVREFVSEAAQRFGFTDEDVSKIALAVDEACTNVIKHAYKFDPSKKITVSVKGSNGAFEVSIVDSGRQFEPKSVPAPDMKEYLTHYRRGGLGIHLMKSLMDKVEYTIRPGQWNEVRLIKYINR